MSSYPFSIQLPIRWRSAQRQYGALRTDTTGCVIKTSRNLLVFRRKSSSLIYVMKKLIFIRFLRVSLCSKNEVVMEWTFRPLAVGFVFATTTLLMLSFHYFVQTVKVNLWIMRAQKIIKWLLPQVMEVRNPKLTREYWKVQDYTTSSCDIILKSSIGYTDLTSFAEESASWFIEIVSGNHG